MQGTSVPDPTLLGAFFQAEIRICPALVTAAGTAVRQVAQDIASKEVDDVQSRSLAGD